MESKLGLSNHSLRSALPHIDRGVIRTSQGCIGEVLGMLCINCGTQTTIAVTPHSSIITGRSQNLIIFKIVYIMKHWHFLWRDASLMNGDVMLWMLQSSEDHLSFPSTPAPGRSLHDNFLKEVSQIWRLGAPSQTAHWADAWVPQEI